MEYQVIVQDDESKKQTCESFKKKTFAVHKRLSSRFLVPIADTEKVF